MSQTNFHFEQVPLEIVRQQIAQGQIVEMPMSDNDISVPLQPEEDDARDLQYPEWQVPYREALLELDHDKLQERVAIAESAIARRLQSLNQALGNSSAERRALADALSSLRVLKQDRFDRSA